MPKYVKWEVANKPQNEYNIGDKQFSFGKQGISTVDIIVIVIASILIISSGFFLYKSVSTLNKVTQEIEDMKINNESKQETIKKLAALGENEQILKEEYERNEIYIPKSKNSEGIMSDVDNIVNDNGATFVKLEYLTEGAISDGLIDVPFKLKVQGTYDQVNNILVSFSKTERLYVVDKVDSIKTNANSETIDSEIMIHAYYKP